MYLDKSLSVWYSERIMSKAFVYIWYDALNKMYYLGSSIGKDPNYAHSSFVMESFTMKTKPAHMHRKQLAFGTHDEMLALESEFQANRKERCWDRYYNEVVCDGVYGGFGSGEKNPKWKDGRYSNDPKAYRQSPQYKAYFKAYDQTPERKEYMKEYDKKRNATPERIAYKKKWDVERYAKKKAEAQGEGTLETFLK